MLALNLLGPVELRRDGVPLRCHSRKLLAVLLRLALAGPQSRRSLVALLWPELDESSARRNLRRDLFRLRDLGAADAVEADDDRLALAPAVGLDLAEFELRRRGATPEQALALWRGPLAADLEMPGLADFNDWLAGERERLQALWHDTLEAAAAGAEAAGQPEAAAALLERLLADDPLQERHHRALMRLLAAAGRREGALQQFERCQALLAAELGLQPMPETVALARALRDEPAPAATPALPRAWPDELPFVGREAEVAQLQRAWTQGRPLLLVGEAGVGKTRLASDFAAAQGPHARVRCQPGDAELPFAAFARALRALAGQPPDLSSLPGWIPAELARILPELGPPPAALRNGGERLRFDEACLQAWAGLAHESFDAIVLDDWQLADPDSRTLLARAAARRREGGGGPVEILAWRGAPDEPALRAQAQSLGAEPVVLERLSAAAVQALVRELTGAADPRRFATRLQGATGGLPFFIAETLRDLAERGLLRGDGRGQWSMPLAAATDDELDLPLPPSVRDAVLARVGRLDAAGVRLLEAAVLAGEPFQPARLAPACALSESEALQALELAAQAQLVCARDEGGYGWVHDLARQALDAALAPTRRRLLHQRLALAAEAAGDALAAARHFESGGEPARSVRHRLAAGDAALALQALAEALAQWRLGLADGPAPAEEVALLARLAETGFALGLIEDARDWHERLQQRLPEVPMEPAARADAAIRSARYLMHSGHGDAAFAALGSDPPAAPPALRHRWWVTRIGALQGTMRLDEAHAEALAALQGTPQGRAERADLLHTLSMVELYRGPLADAVEHASAALTLYERLGDGIGCTRALFHRGCGRMEMGDAAGGAADLRASADRATRLGHVYIQRLALYNLAAAHSNQTRPAEALAVAQEAWASLASEPDSDFSLMFRTLFIECHHMRGEWGALWDHLEPALAQVLKGNQPLTLLGVANSVLEPAATLGQWATVQPLVAAIERTGLFERAATSCEILLACAQAALIRREPAEAARWLARAASHDGVDHARVRCRLALLQVQLALCTGSPAPCALPEDDAPGMNAELRLRRLALRWAAAPTPALRLLAAEALADPQAHAGAALLLAQVLGPEVLAAQLQRALGALAGWPALQDGLRATWTA